MPSRARSGVAIKACSIVSAIALTVVVSGVEGVKLWAQKASAERAVPNDNRAAAGRLRGGVLILRLEAREADWYPEGASRSPLPVFAFAEAGRPSSVPGPMIRVPVGTEIRVTLRNVLPRAMRLRGLQERAGGALDSVVIAPNATHEFRFRADVPGTYYYWGRTEPISANALLMGRGRDGPLVGAIVVDPAGTTPPKGERVLIITGWADSSSALGVKSDQADRVMRREVVPRDDWFVVAVNGGSWPHTERLSYAVGDTARWRVINATGLPHPMHLHGFYFDVDARGDAQRDTAYRSDRRRAAVTEWMVAGSTMAMTWIPARAGNWLFHCHIVTHVSDALRLPSRAEDRHGPNEVGHANHAERGMAGLVMGIRVSGRNTAAAHDPRPRRMLRLFVTERSNVYGDQPGYSYILQEGPTPPAPDSIRGAGSTLVLRQNEPTEITVVNAAKHMTAVHWHGIELESFYDGVGGWSGWGTRVAPPIAPGDSFVVRLTPPRAGTFIYHTHVEEGTQLASGLYGALLVFPEGGGPDTTDRVVLVSIGGPHDDAPPLVNGSTTPASIEVRAGVAHRFRLINISPLETHIVQLASGGAVQEWRAVAKDGADLPAHQATTRRARLLLHPGETYDFEILRSRPESLSLMIDSPGTVASRVATRMRSLSAPIPRSVMEIPVIVR